MERKIIIGLALATIVLTCIGCTNVSPIRQHLEGTHGIQTALA